MGTTGMGITEKRPDRIHGLVALAALLATLSASLAQGADIDERAASLEAGIGHSDNVRRTATNATGDEIASAGVSFATAGSGSRTTFDAVGDLQYVDYLENSYKGRVIGAFEGFGRIAFAPERLSWFLADNFGQARSNQFTAITPENQENINYVTTGPDLDLPFGRETRLRLSPRYSLVTYQKTPQDHSVLGGSGSLEHDLSLYSMISLNMRSFRTEFTNDQIFPGYDQQEAFLSYSARLHRTRAQIDMGINQVRSRGKTGNGALGRLWLDRQISEYSTISMQIGREFSDAGDVFRQMQTTGGVSLALQPIQISGDPFTHTYATLGWKFSRSRTSIDVNIRWEKDDYRHDVTQNRRLIGFDGHLDRQLTPSTHISIFGYYLRQEYAVAAANSREPQVGASFTWQIGRLLSAALVYERDDRRSSIPQNQFKESQYWLRIGYGGRGIRSRLNLGTAASAADFR